jgi:hypothetical protein
MYEAQPPPPMATRPAQATRKMRRRGLLMPAFYRG